MKPRAAFTAASGTSEKCHIRTSMKQFLRVRHLVAPAAYSDGFVVRILRPIDRIDFRNRSDRLSSLWLNQAIAAPCDTGAYRSPELAAEWDASARG